MRRGFTLVEMIMTLVIAAILSVVVAVAIANSINAVQLNAAATRLASDLRYAQTSAGSSGSWHGVRFDLSPLNQYTIYSTDGLSDATIENPAKLGAGFVVQLGADNGVSIPSVNISGGSQVEFSPLGTPYDDKNLNALAAEGVITLTRNGSSLTVRITPNTGRINIQ